MTLCRSAAPEDAPAIRLVLEASFPTDAEASLVEALRASGNLVISHVAELEERIIGHVAFSPVTVAGATGVGLAPLAVLPEHRREGIGGQLVASGLDACERLGAGFVVVLGDPRYYGRFGFRAASEWGLSDEYGGGAAFQAMELRPGAIPSGGGLARYGPEFACFGAEPA
jgi:putative acetyltransferase